MCFFCADYLRSFGMEAVSFSSFTGRFRRLDHLNHSRSSLRAKYASS